MESLYEVVNTLQMMMNCGLAGDREAMRLQGQHAASISCCFYLNCSAAAHYIAAGG
jgi:hypothetical protein